MDNSTLPTTLFLKINGVGEWLPVEAAMRRFHEARAAGKDASLTDKDASTAGTVMTGKTGEVSALAESRVKEQKKMLLDLGFSPVATVYAEGTRVNQTGRDNFRAFRDEVMHAPSGREALRKFVGQIEAEKRRDLVTDLADWRMNPDGTVTRGKCDLALTPDCFRGFLGRAGIGGAAYLASCPPDLRATNVNHWLGNLKSGEAEAKIRLRMAENAAYAIVSPSYTAVDGDVVGKAIYDLPGLDKDWRGQTLYRPDSGRWEVTLTRCADEVIDLAAGDVFKVQCRISGDDTGSGRVRVNMGFWRNLCLNLIILDHQEIETASRVHRGRPEAILLAIRRAVHEAMTKLGPILSDLRTARETVVKDHPMLGQETALEALREIVGKRKIEGLPIGAAPEAKRDVFAAFERALRKEPGNKVMDVVNALTRAAHEESIFSANFDWQRAIESHAGALVAIPR